MNGDARGLKLRLVLLTLALYLPLILLFTFATNAHDYFLRLQALGATPILTIQFTIPVMGGDPHGPGGFDRGHSPVFFAFWGLLFAGPALVSVWVSRARDRTTAVEWAVQGLFGYGIVAASLLLLLVVGALVPFL